MEARHLFLISLFLSLIFFFHFTNSHPCCHTMILSWHILLSTDSLFCVILLTTSLVLAKYAYNITQSKAQGVPHSLLARNVLVVTADRGRYCWNNWSGSDCWNSWSRQVLLEQLIGQGLLEQLIRQALLENFWDIWQLTSLLIGFKIE